MSFELFVGVVALVAAVALGTVVHELLHALALGAAGVPFEVRWLGGDRSTSLEAGVFGTWASVHLRRVPEDLSAWKLRTAALAPLLLALPLGGVALGVLPDPFDGGHLAYQLGVIGWLACAIPSPQDFSLVWYAGAVIDGSARSPDA